MSERSGAVNLIKKRCEKMREDRDMDTSSAHNDPLSGEIICQMRLRGRLEHLIRHT